MKTLQTVFAYAVLLAAPLFSAAAAAGDPPAPEGGLPPGDEIIRRVNERDMGQTSEQTMVMTLREKNGKERSREMKAFRKYYGEEKRRVVFFLAPANIKGTALLTYDYPDPGKPDDQWLYLPAMRKVRRIPTAERGDAFIGTDFTYQDMNVESHSNVDEHTWKTLCTEDADGSRCYVVEGVPVSDRLKKELGYAKVHLWIDAEKSIMRKSELWNPKGDLFKRVSLLDYRDVSGIPIPFIFQAENLKTGHSTVITVSDAKLNGDVQDDIFTVRALEQGL